uniref:Uncharacterized protein n=1 Tax=Arundo donax TaxID=35708 RepID=A0A0A8Y1Z6_ARUDO
MPLQKTRRLQQTRTLKVSSSSSLTTDQAPPSLYTTSVAGRSTRPSTIGSSTTSWMTWTQAASPMTAGSASSRTCRIPCRRPPQAASRRRPTACRRSSSTMTTATACCSGSPGCSSPTAAGRRRRRPGRLASGFRVG